MDYEKVVHAATSELLRNLLNVDPAALDVLLTSILAARKIALYGVGREGLALKGFAMRLFHLGLQASAGGVRIGAAPQ